MRNLALITLLLLFCMLHSATSRIFQWCSNNTSRIEMVNGKNEREGFELYLKLPSFDKSVPFCTGCLHPGSKEGCKTIRNSVPGFFAKQKLFTNVIPCSNGENGQQDLLELHNTKEITIGYFMML